MVFCRYSKELPSMDLLVLELVLVAGSFPEDQTLITGTVALVPCSDDDGGGGGGEVGGVGRLPSGLNLSLGLLSRSPGLLGTDLERPRTH